MPNPTPLNFLEGEHKPRQNAGHWRHKLGHLKLGDPGKAGPSEEFVSLFVKDQQHLPLKGEE